MVYDERKMDVMCNIPKALMPDELACKAPSMQQLVGEVGDRAYNALQAANKISGYMFNNVRSDTAGSDGASCMREAMMCHSHTLAELNEVLLQIMAELGT